MDLYFKNNKLSEKSIYSLVDVQLDMIDCLIVEKTGFIFLSSVSLISSNDHKGVFDTCARLDSVELLS